MSSRPLTVPLLTGAALVLVFGLPAGERVPRQLGHAPLVFGPPTGTTCCHEPANANPDRLFPALAHRQQKLLREAPLLQLLPYADGHIALALVGTAQHKPLVRMTYRGPLRAAEADLAALRARLGERPGQLALAVVPASG